MIVSFGYILNGFYVGWSSKFFSFEEDSSDSHYVSFVIQFKIEPFPVSDVWRQFDFFYHFMKSASPISNIMDHFGISSRRRDCIDFAVQMLLFLRDKISAARIIYSDSSFVGVDNNLGVGIFYISLIIPG